MQNARKTLTYTKDNIRMDVKDKGYKNVDWLRAGANGVLL